MSLPIFPGPLKAAAGRRLRFRTGGNGGTPSVTFWAGSTPSAPWASDPALRRQAIEDPPLVAAKAAGPILSAVRQHQRRRAGRGGGS
mmetsp:Transcript_53896/g.122842  ORF Transcript_53896/g.122842 Transcript_53896/m.122842 type:complete len:87 (-) Transcript_53896:476-736(-)